MRCFLAARLAIATAVVLVAAACSSSSPVKEASEASAAAADAYAKGLVRGIDRGKHDRAMADLESARRALEQYAADQSGYPDAMTCDDLLSKLPSRGVALPAKDPWGNDYACRSGQSGYSLRSSGDDGAAGTADDVVLSGGAPPAS